MADDDVRLKDAEGFEFRPNQKDLGNGVRQTQFGADDGEIVSIGKRSDPAWDGVAANPSLIAIMKGVFLQGTNTAPVPVSITGQPIQTTSTAGSGGGTVSAPVNSVAPSVNGTAQVGQTLTVSNGTWSNSPTSYAYQWKRAGAAITGATSQTYVPVSADIGAVLTCTVTATNAGGSASATSAGTSAVTDVPVVNFLSRKSRLAALAA